jgi:hypothetical protein
MRLSPRPCRRGFALAALALLAAACSDEPTAPARTPAGGARAAASAGAHPRFVANAVKYRDAGAKPATGRSGSSSLAVRALLGMDGVTQLEVTTGSFDGGRAATTPLAKVQVKQLGAGGRVLRT